MDKDNKKVSFFDPVAGSYREINIETAEKYIKVAEELKKEIKKNEQEKS